ncbi:AarF/ABC1/UbiB kinase family protein [Algiphilus sp. W345]|uniref:AarF/ABC1/UbiB kinase family protein n=1 Tax=Banduia mediterranea TaxID=3075609 RepID=A0ABU2WJ25_9GAMM|nr:AarF/ABC1/UbiB kinase family protein [Algiphilus sp. W345]MDT0497842.1 AarF/ABC1/UbiB kinase family protein [Algiphilus sp. W345]
MNSAVDPQQDEAFIGLKVTPLQRNAALARMGAGMGARFVAHSARNLFRDADGRSAANQTFYREQAQQLVEQLGQLKGSVMKAGQLLALYGAYFLPEDAVGILGQLQDLSQPVPWRTLEPIVRRGLGTAQMAQLDIDETAIGAASLGQVHRARRKSDGLELCLKVQYPGVADAIDSDIRTLSRLLILSRITPRGLDLRPMFDELRQMLRQEVDYRRERRYTQLYAERLQGDARFAVPRMLPEYCGLRVLTMTYESGRPVSDPQIRALSQARRNRYADALLDLFLTELFGWGMVQSDPNFGNYLFRPGTPEGDALLLLDFGAVRRFRPAFVEAYAEIVRGALLHERPRIIRGAAAIGILREDFPQSVLDGFSRMCEALVEPFAEPPRGGPQAHLWNARGEYRWGRSDLPERAALATAASTVTVHFRLPPREIVFLHRRLTGMFMMLAALDAELDGRERLCRALKLP